MLFRSLRAAVLAYLRYISRNRRAINLVYRETRALPREKRQEIFSIEQRFASHWQSIIDDGVAAGAFTCPNSAIAAHAVYFVCTMWSLRFWALDSYSEAQVADSLMELVLNGLRADGPRATAHEEAS